MVLLLLGYKQNEKIQHQLLVDGSFEAISFFARKKKFDEDGWKREQYQSQQSKRQQRESNPKPFRSTVFVPTGTESVERRRVE